MYVIVKNKGGGGVIGAAERCDCPEQTTKSASTTLLYIYDALGGGATLRGLGKSSCYSEQYEVATATSRQNIPVATAVCTKRQERAK